MVSPAARQDLADIRDFLVRRGNRRVAARVLRELRGAVARLAAAPGIGHVREDLAPKSIRFYRVYKYLIVYRAESRPLAVVRVLHGARDVRSILSDE
jgi:toxin ParE1/3/4